MSGFVYILQVIYSIAVVLDTVSAVLCFKDKNYLKGGAFTALALSMLICMFYIMV